jgi:hypothetical protein
MAATEAAAHMAATEAAAHMAATEAAAHMAAAAEPATVSTATATATATRKRVGGQSPGESGSLAKTIMLLRNIRLLLRRDIASIRLNIVTAVGSDCANPNRPCRIHAYIHRSAGCDSGPLMTGACEGDVSGPGIRLWNVGICGAGLPRRVVGLRAKPPRPPAPCPMPPRAKPEVDPATQVTANTTAKRRFMIAFLALR